MSGVVIAAALAAILWAAWPVLARADRRLRDGAPADAAPDATPGPVRLDDGPRDWIGWAAAWTALAAAAALPLLAWPWRAACGILAAAAASSVAAWLPWARRTGAGHPDDLLAFLAVWPRLRSEEEARERYRRDVARAKRLRALRRLAGQGARAIAACLAANAGPAMRGADAGPTVGVRARVDPEAETVEFSLAYPRGIPLQAARDAWVRLAETGILAHALGLRASQGRLVDVPGGEALVVAPFGAGPKPAGADEGEPAREPLPQLGTDEGDDADERSPLADGCPPLEILRGERAGGRRDESALAALAGSAIDALESVSKVPLEPVGYTAGAAVLVAVARMPKGTRVDALTGHGRNVAAAIGTDGVRIAPLFTPPPGTGGGNLVAVEVVLPESAVLPVMPAAALGSPASRRAPGTLPLVVGVTPHGGVVTDDLARFPHLLVAGQTGGGKSVFLHSLLVQTLMRHGPDRVRLRLADLKGVELVAYVGAPHLDGDVVTSLDGALRMMAAAVDEMEHRYALLQATRVRDVDGYNALARERGASPLPHVVLVVDEFADLTVQGSRAERQEFEALVQRLAQKARAAGIHLVLTTQRPTKDAISPTVKANLPVRVAFRCANERESRIVLDRQGAEALRGRGDLLFVGPTRDLVRAQSLWVSEAMVQDVVRWWRERAGKRGRPADAPGGAAPGSRTSATDTNADGRETAASVSDDAAAVPLELVTGAHRALTDALRARRPALESAGDAVWRDGYVAAHPDVVRSVLESSGLRPDALLRAMADRGLVLRGQDGGLTSIVKVGGRPIRMIRIVDT